MSANAQNCLGLTKGGLNTLQLSQYLCLDWGNIWARCTSIQTFIFSVLGGRRQGWTQP